MRERLRGIRYFFADIGYALGRLPRALGRGAGAFWRSLSLGTRQRLALVVAAVAMLVLVWAIASAGDDAGAPADDADNLVPADALAYAHADLGGEQFEQMERLAKGLPQLSGLVSQRLLALVPGPRGGPPDFKRQIEPWLADEVALAVLPAGGRPEQVYLLEVGDSEGAERYAKSLLAGRPETEDHEGVELQTDERGVAAAEVGGFLVVGTDDSVRGVIDVEAGAGDASSLAADDAADEIRAELPTARLADLYVSEKGVSELVERGQGVFGSLQAFVGAGASQGAAAALVTGEDGVELSVRSALDPKRADSAAGFFAAFPSFEPSVAAELPDNALAYLGLGDPGATLAELLSQASADAPGVAAGFTDLAERLSELDEVDLRGELLPALNGESAVAIVPGKLVSTAEAGGEAEPEGTTTVPPPVPDELPEGQPPPAPQPGTPYLEAITEDVDEEATADALEALEDPIAETVVPPEGDEPAEFRKRRFGDVEARSIELTPVVELTYAVFDSRLVVATDPVGVRNAVEGEGGLDQASEFERATEGFPGEVSLLAFLDLTSLIELAEREGLAADPDYANFASEVRRLEALGLAVAAGDDSLATDVRLLIGEPPSEAGASPPAPGD